MNTTTKTPRITKTLPARMGADVVVLHGQFVQELVDDLMEITVRVQSPVNGVPTAQAVAHAIRMLTVWQRDLSGDAAALAPEHDDADDVRACV